MGRFGLMAVSLTSAKRKEAPRIVPRGKRWRLAGAPLLVAGASLFATAGFSLAAPGLAFASDSGFVGSSGTGLTLHGHPWRFVGFNDYQLTSMPGGAYFCGRPTDDATLNSVLRDAKKSGATVIRTWFFQSYYDMNSQGEWIHPTWTAFDRVLNAAATYGLKVVPVLINEWQSCEPPSTNKNLGFFQAGYEQPGSYGYPLSFKMYTTTVAQHYANNTQIAFWQIGNELQNYTDTGCDSFAERAGASTLRAFADDMTAAIKAVDPNHLVSLGTAGGGECGLSQADYQYVNAGAIDICDYHDYYDVTQAMPDDGYNRLAQRIAQCRALNKPIVVTESGIAADVDSNGQDTGTVTSITLQNRASFFQAKLAAAFSSGIAGYVLWEKEQDASNSAENFNHGLFEIGRNDPTNSVTASMAKSLRGLGSWTSSGRILALASTHPCSPCAVRPRRCSQSVARPYPDLRATRRVSAAYQAPCGNTRSHRRAKFRLTHRRPDTAVRPRQPRHHSPVRYQPGHPCARWERADHGDGQRNKLPYTAVGGNRREVKISAAT